MHLHQTIAEIAALLRGQVIGPEGAELESLRSLGSAGPQDLAAVFRPQYFKEAGASRARCLIVPGTESSAESAALQEQVRGEGRSLICVEDPELAVDTIVATFGPREVGPAEGIHPSAVVEDGAELDPSVAVGPWSFVGRGARIGPGTKLWARSYVGAEASVGAGCKLYPGSYLGERCVMGDRGILHPGAVLGADGFGFRVGKDGAHIKSPQVGVVLVGNDVEIGANTTIDRARLESTVIGDGVKIDDQVHIAHNCSVGDHTAIAGHASLAGGAHVGKHVLMAGRAAISSQIHVSDKTTVGGCAIVMQDPLAGEYVLGYPAVPHHQWKRQISSLKRLPALLADLRAARSEGSDSAS